MKAAEEGEEEPRSNGHGNGQKYCDYPVDPNSGHLKQGVTPDPDPVAAAH